MNAKDVKEIVKKIDGYYNTNKHNEEWYVKEWHKVLKDYDFEDISKKIDNYYETQNTEFAPKLAYLVKYTQTQAEKEMWKQLQECILNNSKHQN